MSKKSVKKNVLFTPSTVLRGNVVLNFLDAPISEFPQYANTFRRAGWRLAEKFANVRGYNDLEALPIVYLYRHSLELFLKGIFIVWQRSESLKNREEYNLKDLLVSHRLTPLLDDPEEMDKADHHGFVFRYPVEI